MRPRYGPFLQKRHSKIRFFALNLILCCCKNKIVFGKTLKNDPDEPTRPYLGTIYRNIIARCGFLNWQLFKWNTKNRISILYSCEKCPNMAGPRGTYVPSPTVIQILFYSYTNIKFNAKNCISLYDVFVKSFQTWLRWHIWAIFESYHLLNFCVNNL